VAVPDPTLSPLSLGRIAAHRARLLWKSGNIDGARHIYDQLAELGAEFGETELKARAWLGHGTIAQLRGDLATMQRCFRSSARLAIQCGDKRLARLALSGLFVVASERQRFNDALVYGWKMYELAGDEPKALAE